MRTWHGGHRLTALVWGLGLRALGCICYLQNQKGLGRIRMIPRSQKIVPVALITELRTESPHCSINHANCLLGQLLPNLLSLRSKPWVLPPHSNSGIMIALECYVYMYIYIYVYRPPTIQPTTHCYRLGTISNLNHTKKEPLPGASVDCSEADCWSFWLFQSWLQVSSTCTCQIYNVALNTVNPGTAHS